MDEAERVAKLEAIEHQSRLAFVEGAEDWARRELGRPLSTAELARVLARYPGHPEPDRRPAER